MAKIAKMPESGAGRAGPGPGAGLGPARLQVWAPGAAPGPAHPPGRGPGPGRIPLWRPKDTLLKDSFFQKWSEACYSPVLEISLPTGGKDSHHRSLLVRWVRDELLCA